MNDNIPELTIEFDDGTGDGLIVLEQDCSGNVDRVAIHPIHVRYLAEKTGLIATSDPHAQRTIAMLTRRLNLLHNRIDHLAEWLAKHSDHEHADLSYETTYATATADIADEFCADLDHPHLQTFADTPARIFERFEDRTPAMNRNNRLYTLEADGEKKFTAAGLLLQFWILSEGGGEILNGDEQRLARRVLNNVMDAWQAITDAPLTHRSLPEGIRGSDMSDVQLLRLIDTIEEACVALGADRVFEIIYPLQSASVH